MILIQKIICKHLNPNEQKIPNSYKLTNKAVEDLAEIWHYTIEYWSEQQADKYYALLLKSCQAIANNPDVGKKYAGITTDLWGFKTNKHIIFIEE